MEKLLSKYAKTFAISVLVGSIFLMGVIIYEVSQTKHRFATNLISQSIEQTRSEINAFFTPIRYLLLSEKSQLERDADQDLTTKDLNLRFIPVIKNHPQISSIAVADLRGYEHNIIPDTLKNMWLNRMIFVEEWGNVEKWRRLNLADSLVQTESWEEEVLIDPRERPWFKGALKSKDNLFWTKPYQYTTDSQFGITASVQYKKDSQTDTLTKILAFDLTLNDINRFVKELKLTDNQNVFLLTEDNSNVISQHHASGDIYIDQSKQGPLLSPDGMENSALLKVLKQSENQKAFEFQINGENWWGIMKPYYLTSSLTFNIVTVLPEKDFAKEINQTQWVILFCFGLILILTIIIVTNHNNLHRIGNVLSDKNKLISEQKEILFSEVHHRVKNNLALLSAFLELDQLQTTDDTAITLMDTNKKRIKVIALVQELGYHSKKLGTVPIDELAATIASSFQETTNELNIEAAHETININQAQSYGLLLNELLAFISTEGKPLPEISLDVSVEDEHLVTQLTVKNSHKKDQYSQKLKDRNIIHALLNQLKADHSITTQNLFTYSFTFRLEDKKGVAGNRFYPK